MSYLVCKGVLDYWARSFLNLKHCVHLSNYAVSELLKSADNVTWFRSLGVGKDKHMFLRWGDVFILNRTVVVIWDPDTSREHTKTDNTAERSASFMDS